MRGMRNAAAAITSRKGERLIVAVDIIDRAAVFREIGRAEHVSIAAIASPSDAPLARISRRSRPAIREIA